MPTFTDDFNRADAASLGANYGTESGVAGSLAIASNRAAIPDATGLQDYSNIRTAETIGGAQYSQAKIQNLSSGDYAQGYVSVRGSTSALQGYRFYLDTTGATQLYDLVDDAAVGSAGSHTLTPGDVFTLIARGSALNGFVNGTLECSATDATTATGQPGLGAFALSATVAAGDVQLDDHAGGDLPVGTPVAGTAAAGTGTTVTPTAPSGLIDEDFVFVVAHTSDQQTLSKSTNGETWTQIAQGNGGGTSSRIAVWWTRYEGAALNYEVTRGSGGTTTFVANCYRVSAFESGKRVKFDVVSTIGTGTDASIEHNTATPTDNFSLALFINGVADDNTRTTPAGVVLIATDKSASGTPDGGISVMCRDAMAAATGTVTITQGASDPWASMTVILTVEDIPAGGASTGTVPFPKGQSRGLGRGIGMRYAA